MNLVYFVILISSLIFVHELGHFIVAKLFGVKVLMFSLGFGPKILRFQGKETEYCVGLLPLGGFVKMLEESKSDHILAEDAKRTFEAQPVWRRVLIVVAGPLMNLLFPTALYFVTFLGDREMLPPTVGIVLPGHPASGKLQPGDRIMSVNGEPIATYPEFRRIVRKSPGKPLRLHVFRNLGYVDVTVVPEPIRLQRELEIVDIEGRVGIIPGSPRAVIGISDIHSPAYRAGLRTFDDVIQVGAKPINKFIELQQVFDNNRGEMVPVVYLRPEPMQGVLGGLADMAVYRAGVAALTPSPKKGTLTERTGIESSDTYVATVPEDSAEAKAGLRPGDKILRVDGKPVLSWHSLEETLLAKPDDEHRLTWLRDGRTMMGKIRVRREEWVDELGVTHTRHVIRAKNWRPLAPEPLVSNPHPIRWAAINAVDETKHVMRFIWVGMVRLVQGKLSLSSISGPIGIYEVAGREGAKGTDYFLWVMGLVSLNLGFINLLPIPVLDGGHLLFFAIEAIIRRPLPRRVKEIASLVGVIILLLMMAVAFKNDLDRRWDIIFREIKGLFE